MYPVIRHRLVRVSTWKLVTLTVVSSLILTTGLSSLISFIGWGRISLEVLLIGTIDAILVPAIVAPLLINLVKHTTRLEELTQVLRQEMTERKRAETEARQQAESLLVVNELAIECAAAGPEVDLLALIADKLQVITNALAVSVSTYDAQTRALTIRHLAVPGSLLATLNGLLSRNIIGMQLPVSEEMRQRMVSEVVGMSQDLTEVTFGTIPKPVAAVIHKTFGIAGFTGLAFTYGDELVGSAMIVTREGQAPLSPELANVLAHVAAVSLRRKQAEEALWESERRLKIIMENSMDIIYIANRQGQITFISPQVAALGGVPEEIIGHPIAEFIYPDDRARVLTGIEEMIATGVASPVEFRLATPDNRVVHLEERGHLMLQEEQVVGFFGIIRDISERKQAEAEREKLITELEAKNTELERFTYTVSHDLKSPLITINGFLSFLEKDVLSGHNDRVKADVTRIKEAVEKMRGLLDDLLKLSRIGRLMNPPQTAPFADLAHEAVRLVAGQLEARQIQVEIAPDLPSVYGDRVRLVEALQNLIDNAVKFMGEQPQPRLQIGVKPGPGETVFYVQDNGSGIEPRYQEEIFGLFKRLDPATEGSGIGLALVKRIVEVHGGRVWVESEGLGRGATFYFTLAAPPQGD